MYILCFSALVWAQAEGSDSPQWLWAGDLRYRVAKSKENIDEERHFQQLRARLGAKVKINNDLNAQIRLATGTTATSTNQTLGDSKDPGMPRRNFGLDLAFLDWRFFPDSNVWLGRTPNPFWAPGKNQMVFDSDLSFEGLALKADWTHPYAKLFFNLGSSMISENYDSTARQDVVDTGIAGAQIGVTAKTDWGDGTVHYAHFEYINIQDKNIKTIDINAKTDVYSNPYDRFKGNTVYRPDPLVQEYYYKNKYILKVVGMEWKWTISDLELLLFSDHVENYEASRVNTATESGVGLRWGRSQLFWSEVDKEAESVVGAFSDSDMNGGGSDNQGQKMSYTYQFSGNSQISFTQFQARRGVDSVPRDYSSSQLDFLVWF